MMILSRSHTRATLIPIAPRSQILFERVESVLKAWPNNVFCDPLRSNYDVLESYPRSYCVQQAFITLYTTLNTTFAQRLHCAHCVFTTTNRFALRAYDAITASKQRSPSINCALVTLLLRLHHALSTGRLRLPRSCYINIVSFSGIIIIIHSPNAINIK